MECKDDRNPKKIAVSFKFKVIIDQFASKLNNQQQQDDITFSQMAIIGYLAHCTDHDVTLKELSQACHIKHPTAIGLINRLEDKGMVVSSVNEANRKYRIISITDKGLDYFEFSKKRLDNMNSALLSPLSEEEQKMLSEMLDRIIENMASI